MNFPQLVEIIKKQQSGSSFILLASDFLSDSISQIFRKFTTESKFSFNQAKLTIDEDAETIQLGGHLKEKFLGQANLKTTVEFTVVNGQAEVLFTFSGFPEDWKLSDVLPQTKGRVVDEFIYYMPAFQLDSQCRHVLAENFQTEFDYPEEVPASQLELKNGLTFSAKLIRKDLPSKFQWFFSQSDDTYLPIKGPILIKFDQPGFWFSSESVTFSLMGQEVSINLELIGITLAQAKAKGPFMPQYWGRIVSNFTIPLENQSPLKIPLIARFAYTDLTLLIIESNLSEVSLLGVEALEALMGGTSNSNVIPDFFPSFDQIRLEKVGFAFNLTEKHLLSFWFLIGFDKEWKLFDGAFRVYGMRLFFNISSPLDSNARHVSVTVQGTLGIGNVDLSFRLILDTAEFTASLAEEEEIPLSELVTTTMGLPLDLPEIAGSQFYLAGNLKENCYDFSTTLESDWTIDWGSGQLTIQKLRLFANYQGKAKSQLSQTSGEVYGEFSLGTNLLFVKASYNPSDKSWNFAGGTVGISEISLTSVASELAQLFNTPLPNAVPHISLKNLTVEFNNKAKFFTFIGEVTVPGKIPLANREFELQTRINLQSFKAPKTRKRVLTGTVEAYLELGNHEWMIHYELAPQAKKIEASWRSTDETGLTLEAILDVLGLEKVDIPDGLDFTLVQIELVYDVSQQFATLSARTQEGMDAYLTAGKSNNRWAFVFGINMQLGGGKLSSLPGIGSSLKMADFLTVNQAGILVASSEIKGYQPPALPTLPTTTEGGSTALAPIQPINATSQVDLTRGISVMADLDLATQGSGDGILGQILSVIPESKLLFQVTYSPTEVAYYAALSGEVNLPTNKEVWLSINHAAVRFQRTLMGVVYQVMGGFRFSLFGETLTVTLRAIFETNGAAVAASLEADEDGLPGPPGLKGFHLYQLGMLMGVENTPPSVTLALQGKFQIGVGKSSLNEFGLALQIIEKVPNPQYLSFYLEEAGFDELITLVTDKPASGMLKSLQAIQGYDLSFYWANDKVVLPDGTVALPGFGFSGMLTFFGFGAFGEFVMMTDQGIKGSAQLSPIDLGGILKITGNGPGIKRVYEEVDGKWQLVDNVKATKSLTGGDYKEDVIVKPGGAIVKFNALSDPMLYLSWDITLFDFVGQKVEAIVSTKGIAFTFTYKVSSALLLAIECELKSWSQFSANAEFLLDLDMTIPGFKVLGVKVGNLKLDTELEATLKLEVSSKKFFLEINGDFEFQGMSLDLPKITLDVSPGDLKKLPQWISKEIEDNAEDIFKEIFNTADDLANLMEKGIISGVDDVAGVFKDTFNVSAQKAAELVKDVGGTAEEALDAVVNVYGAGAEEIADIGENLGMAADEVGDFLKNTGGYTDEAVSAALQGAGYTVEEVWDFMKNAYGWFQHVDVKHVDQNAVSWHADASKRFHLDKRKHFDVKVARKRKHFDYGKTVGLNKKQSLTPHVDVPHVDLEPTPDKPHIDQKGVSIAKGKYGGQSLSSPHFDAGASFKVKVSKWKKHFDLAHLDDKLTVKVPKLPPKHIDVGHVDVGADLDKKS